MSWMECEASIRDSHIVPIESLTLEQRLLSASGCICETGRLNCQYEHSERWRNIKMQSSDLMISVSGVRGIVGQSLTPELLVRLGHAFGTYLHGGRVVVGRDTRVSGEMAKHAVLSGLLASGCEILDLGVCATPTLTLMVEHKHVAGGVMVTASHNPIEWNALKFFRADGMYLNGDESRDLLNIYYS